MSHTNQNRLQRLLRRSTAALRQGNIQEAVALLKQAYALDAENFDVLLNLGGAYILSKKFKRAVPLLEAAREQDPDNPMVWTNLGAAYLGNPVLARDEEQRRAIAAFKKALELNASAPSVAYNIGLIYRDRKEYAEALYWFKAAVKTNPQDRDARHYVRRMKAAVKAADE